MLKKYYQPLNRGHSSICRAGAARGLNSVFLTSCSCWLDFLSPHPTVQLLCCAPAVEGRWQHQNTKIHMRTSCSPGIFHWLLRVFKWLWLSTILMFLKSEDGHRKIAEWSAIFVRNFTGLQRQQQTRQGIFSSTAIVECMHGQSVAAAREFFGKNQCQLYDSWLQRVSLHICVDQLQVWSGKLSDHPFSIFHITYVYPTSDSCRINIVVHGGEHVSISLDNSLVPIRG